MRKLLVAVGGDIRAAVVGVLLAGVGTVLGILRAHQSFLAGPVLYGVVAFASLLIVRREVATHLRTRQARVTPENIEGKVREWLDAFGLTVRKLPEKDAPDAFFALVVTFSSGAGVIVARPTERPRYLVVQVNLGVNEVHQKAFGELTEEKQKRLIRQIRSEMSRARVGWSGIGMPLTTIRLIDRLPITLDLTESAFIAKLEAMEHGTILAENVLIDGIESAPVDSGGSGHENQKPPN